MHLEIWNGYYIARYNSAYYRRRAAAFWYLDTASRILATTLGLSVVANFIGSVPPEWKMRVNIVVVLSGFLGIAMLFIRAADRVGDFKKLASDWDELTARYERLRLIGEPSNTALADLSDAAAELHRRDTASRWNWSAKSAQAEVDRQLGVVRAAPGKSYPPSPPPPPPPSHVPSPAPVPPPTQAPPTPAPAK